MAEDDSPHPNHRLTIDFPSMSVFPELVESEDSHIFWATER